MQKLFYAVVVVAALLLNTALAAQYGPYETAGMGPDPAYQYGDGVEQWRPMAIEVCAVYGCSPDYMLKVIDCETAHTGDPGSVGPNGELGILQIDPAYWGTMTSYEQMVFWANPPAGAWWVCA